MRNIPYENDGLDLSCHNGGSLMTQSIKAMRLVFCSILFISMACGSLAVFGGSLKRIESYKLQANDNVKLIEAVIKALSAANGVRAFRIRIQFLNAGKVSTTTIEYASPDSVRRVTENEEIIWIGKNTYRKKGDGAWEKYPEKNTISRTYLAAGVLRQYIKEIEKSDEAKFIGRETINGIPALGYQHTKYFVSDKSRSITTKTWFNEATGLLLKNQLYNILLSSLLEPINCTFYDFNADIKIEPPTEYVSATDLKWPVPPFTIIDSIGVEINSGYVLGIGAGGSKTQSNASAATVDQKPEPLSLPRPYYTEAARNNKLQGIVRVRALVGVDGTVKRVKILTGLPDGLDEEAILCVYKSRFKPAMKDGQPVEYWVALDVEFNLR